MRATFSSWVLLRESTKLTNWELPKLNITTWFSIIVGFSFSSQAIRTIKISLNFIYFYNMGHICFQNSHSLVQWWFRASHSLDHPWLQADQILGHTGVWFLTDHSLDHIWFPSWSWQDHIRNFVWLVWRHTVVRLWSAWWGNPGF